MPAKYVRPYARRAKRTTATTPNHRRERCSGQPKRSVVTKTTDQLDLPALHRLRERLVSQHIGTINQIRAFALKRGIADAPARMLRIIEDLAADWRRLDARLKSQAAHAMEQDESSGVGLVVGSSLVGTRGRRRYHFGTADGRYRPP
jgi:transposase